MNRLINWCLFTSLAVPAAWGQTLDQYGGWSERPCPGGPAPHFYVQKPDSRWRLCTPAGNTFWMRAVYNVTPNPAAATKYGDTSTVWGPQQVRRLKSWGFNSTAEYSSRYVQPTAAFSGWPGGRQPEPVPFTAMLWPSYYALRNSGNYAPGPVKELVRATLPSVYTGYRAYSPDIWDPNFKAWLAGAIQNDFSAREWLNGPNSEYLVGLNIDDTDWLQGFGAGPDFNTVANGTASGGREQPHLAWIIWITPPAQAANGQFGVTYSDPTVYSKLEFARFLESRYGGIPALNAAWGSNYTTFGSQGGWGTGSGLLDENGTHPWVPRDHRALSDAREAVRRDLDDFLLHHAEKYFSDVRTVLNTYAPGRLYLGPTTLGGWGSPPRRQVLQAAARYIDVFMAPSIPAGTADDQARVDFIAQHLGDKPWLSWEGMMANPDSYFHAFPTPDTVAPNSLTQEARGRVYSLRVSALLNARTAAGVYPVAGLKFWELSDNSGEKANWGLVTGLDNAYDGFAARAALGQDEWGFPTGGEERNYGDFLSAVRQANQSVFSMVVPKAGSNVSLTSSANPSAAGQAVTFTATVGGSGGTPAGAVEFFDGGTLLGTANLASGKASFTTSMLTAGVHNLTASYAGDAAFLGSVSSVLAQTVQNAGRLAIRINAGGGAYTDPQGRMWAADSGYTGGWTYTANSSVANTAAQALYRSERAGLDSYRFSVPDGAYTVTLKFAEIYYSTRDARVFHVNINGRRVLTNFDIVRAAGGAFRAVDRRFPVEVTGGAVVIRFIRSVNQPKVSAISIE